MFADITYDQIEYEASEVEHRYGDRVHILRDPLALTMLARVCYRATVQPAISHLIRHLYTRLIHEVVNNAFPTVRRRVETRMIESTPRGVFDGMLIDPQTRVVTVAIARAGILPSQVCYDYLNEVIEPSSVRQDHLVMSRVTDDNAQVTGAAIRAEKVGGPIDGRIVLFPDPMGATGSSLSKAITYLTENFGSNPAALITLNLIVTPEFVARLRDDHPEVHVYALRLDRGMSDPEVLKTVPGERWDEERGLNETQYIVPGGGGFGEIMNNSYV
jgi:uracil phosphoribosyltransferase